ncbi:gamma-glutamyltransferase [Myxococcota bacterium]|nr:gamma-glutamyltransferase [Myxococcota bacterium]MCZ7620141.1 gamma-glutamyltransferase [Myxococcota bacterium]
MERRIGSSLRRRWGLGVAIGRAAGIALVTLAFGLAAFTAERALAAAPAPAIGTRGMVVSAERHATEAGLALLTAGGNAVDAAVATSFALGVTEPYHSGIGGGGLLLIHLASGETIALDARETAPAAAHARMFLEPGVPDDASRSGPLAVATPGLVAGLVLAQQRWGTRPLADVLAPAIALAEDGFPIGLRHARIIEIWRGMGLAERFPETAAIQTPPPGTPATPGWRLVQKDLARTLRAIARDGADAFYRGPIATAIADEVQRHGGILRAEDLAAYQPKLREPVSGRYRGRTVRSFPPPSSGGIALIQMLNILEGFDLAALGAGSSATIHRVAEAMKLAFADRAAYLGDTDFVDVPVAQLLDEDYAARLRGRLLPPRWRRAPWTWGRDEVAIRVSGPGLGPWPPPSGGTSHFSVTDAAGNAVAVTQTVNLLYGSGLTASGTGVVLNDEMDDFSIDRNRPNAFGLLDTRGQNAVAPGKRPLSSMTPTILLEDGRVRMVTGSPGGPRIISTTLLTILNVFDHGMDVSEAVAAPRFHHQWEPDELRIERAIPVDVRDALRRRGHHVVVSERNWSSAQAIVIDPETGWHLGGSDPRSDGLAKGY